MRSIVGIGVLFSLSLAVTLRAQDVGVDRPVPHRTPSMVERLKAEAAKMEVPKVSPLFKALADPKNRQDLRLSAEQLDLLGQLEELIRDVVKAWLLRDVDALTDTKPNAFSERLSDASERLRHRLIVQAEAIALEGVLNSEQARQLRKITGRKPDPLLPGRYGPPALGASDEVRSALKWPRTYDNCLAELLIQDWSRLRSSGSRG